MGIHLLLLWLLHCFTAESGAVLYVSPSPAGPPCPAEPCHTLSEYAHNIDKYVSDNTKFVFLPGTHYLDTDFRVSNISSLVLVGDNSSLPELSSRVVCNNTASMVAITGVSQLFISTLEVTSCGETVSVSVKEADSFDVISFHLLNSKPLSIYKSTALLEDTNFTNNTGTGCGGSVRIEYSNVTLNGTNSFAYSHTSESGGGMCVMGSSFTANGNVTFHGNTATKNGGGMYANTSQLVKFVSIATFNNNSAGLLGGGLWVYGNATFNGVSLFSNNWCGSGGSAIFCTDSVVFTNDVFIENNSGSVMEEAGSSSTFVVYVGKYFASKQNIFISGNSGESCFCIVYVIGQISLLGNLQFTNNCDGICLYKGFGEMIGQFTFSNNSGTVIHSIFFDLSFSGEFNFRNNSMLEGALSIEMSSATQFLPNTLMEFIGNRAGENGGGFSLNNSTLLLSRNISLKFIDNYARWSGGALSLQDTSIFFLSSNTTLEFFGNTAGGTGGAIYVMDLIPSLYCLSDDTISQHSEDCFLQVLRNYSNINLVFVNNSASVGSDIYGGMLDWCKLVFLDHTTLSELLKYTLTSNYSALDISSTPYQLCYCIENTTKCVDHIPDLTIYPGETINIPLLAMGQSQGISPALVIAYQTNCNTENSLLPLKLPETQSKCSALPYNVTSMVTLSACYTFSVGICGSETTTKRNNVFQLAIHFKSCLPFFVLHSGRCICAAAIEDYVADWIISDQLIAREGTKWIGYDEANYIIYLYCPSAHCSRDRAYFNYSDTDNQCVNNRRGLLCGECLYNHSLMLGTSHCEKCSDYNIFLLAAFAFAGVALVVLLLVLRLTVAEGTISGLVFYTNVFYIRRDQFLGQQIECKFLNVFLAWINLDFGIESCLYDGMDTYQNTWLQFLFPIYIWVLIGIVILSSRHSSWVTRKLGSNPVAVLATLVLLSFNKILQNIITIVSPTELLYYSTTSETNTTATSHWKWLYDGNVSFLVGKHIPLFLTALLVSIVFVFPYTLLIFFGQCIQANSNIKIFSWANRPLLKYFLDSYHAPYQDRHRYWTGLLLLLRILLLTAFACDFSNNPSEYMLLVSTVITGLLSWGWIFGISGIYKNYWIGILDVSMMLNLHIVSATTMYCQKQYSCGEHDYQSVIGYTSLGVAFLTFIGILTYHLHMQFKGTVLGRKLVRLNETLLLQL